MFKYSGFAIGRGACLATLVRVSRNGTSQHFEAPAITGAVIACFDEMPVVDNLVHVLRIPNVFGVFLPALSPLSHHAWALSYYAKSGLATGSLFVDVFMLPVQVYVDFDCGFVLVPERPAECLAEYEYLHRQTMEDSAGQGELLSVTRLPSLLAQIHDAADVSIAIAARADGIGEVKSELLQRDRLAGQTLETESIVNSVQSTTKWSPIPLRFYDFTEEKGMGHNRERDPHGPLGYRGVRLLEREPSLLDDFVQSLGTVDRSALIVVLPMVSAAAEVAVIGERLSAHGLKVGAQIETPAAALAIKQILKFTDYIVLGLNDLTQYTVGWTRDVEHPDRTPSRSLHPGVARLIAEVSREASRIGCHVSLALDLFPSLPLSKDILATRVPSLTVSPRLISTWRRMLCDASTGEAEG